MQAFGFIYANCPAFEVEITPMEISYFAGTQPTMCHQQDSGIVMGISLLKKPVEL
jgi:hypothetical protein